MTASDSAVLVADRPQRRLARGSRRALILALLAAAHLPLAIRYLVDLLARPPYAFAVVALALAIWYAVERSRHLGPLAAGRAAAGWTLLGVDAAVLLTAVLLDSPWLGWLAMMAMCAALVYSVGGWRLAARLAPAGLLLLLTLRPPLNLDIAAAGRVEHRVERMSRAALDALGVLHRAGGGAFLLLDRTVFEHEPPPEARFFLPALATGLFVGWRQRRRRVHLTLLVLASLAWAVAAEVFSLTWVVWAADRWGQAWDAGWPLRLLGCLVALGMMGLVWSTDQLLAVGESWIRAVADRLHFPRSKDLDAARLGGGATALAPAAAPWLGSSLVAGVALLALGGQAARGIGVMIQEAPAASVAADGFSAEREMLPTEADEWNLVDFAAEEVAEPEKSWRWKYEGLWDEATVTLRTPSAGWGSVHDAVVDRGWRLTQWSVVEAAPDGHPAGRFLVLEMVHGAVETHGLVIVGLCEATGQWLSPPLREAGWGDALAARLSWSGPQDERRAESAGAVRRLFLRWSSQAPLTEKTRTQAWKLFLEAAAALVEATDGRQEGQR